jgi:hypothetical protein
MVPWTPHRITDNQSLGEGAAVMRAGRADREEFITAAREKHGIVTHMPTNHASVGNIVEQDTHRKIRSFRLGLLGIHRVLLHRYHSPQALDQTF